MPVSPLRSLVNTKLANNRKITPDDARDILSVIEKDKKFSAEEVKVLKELSALPAKRFAKKDEFIPNPMDPEDGVTVTSNPKKWFESSLRLATATLKVTKSIPELKVELSGVKNRTDSDFGDYQTRELVLSFKGKTASRDGTIDFTYADRHISVAVKKGESMEKVYNRLQSAVLKKESSMAISGFFEPNHSSNVIKFEVL